MRLVEVRDLDKRARVFVTSCNLDLDSPRRTDALSALSILPVTVSILLLKPLMDAGRQAVTLVLAPAAVRASALMLVVSDCPTMSDGVITSQ